MKVVLTASAMMLSKAWLLHFCKNRDIPILTTFSLVLVSWITFWLRALMHVEQFRSTERVCCHVRRRNSNRERWLSLNVGTYSSLNGVTSETWHSCLQISHQLHQHDLCNAKKKKATKLQFRNRLLQIPTQRIWEELIVLILPVGSVESGIDTFFGFSSTYLFVILLFFLLFTMDEREKYLSFALN